jgi:ribosome biogenesis GTPase / thiamine phosphate phosphatase
MRIQDLGWDGYFEAVWNERAEKCGSSGSRNDRCIPARVISQQRRLWRVAGHFAECWAEASGKLRLAADSGGDWPAVGDWVALESCISQGHAIIEQVLPRKSKFSRKEAGKRIAEQVIAANIDKAIVVAALDGDFNPRRIERYLAQCWDSGATPVILLNKADACREAGELLARVEGISMKAATFVVSAKTGGGMEAFEASLAKGETIVFLGSSGVGKSTLVNRLLGKSQQSTQAVREDDSRGRHTTTARELFLLASGAMVIDTPGLRELRLWDAAEGVTDAFADIEELAALCRFRDCKHESEPGCAVLAAMEEGALEEDRLENRRKLEREQEFLLRKMDPEKQHEHRKRIKILFREIRRNVLSRNKDKNRIQGPS